MRRSSTGSRERRGIFTIALSLVFLITTAAHATTITVTNLDGVGEGFNDTTPRSPEGGNPGTTLGALRLNAFQEAADRWAAVVNSGVVIEAESNFDPLFCSSSSALLGFAGPNGAFRDFSGAPVASTYFVQAEANSLHGSDLDGGNADLSATFNSSIDSGCLMGVTGWYYGFDGNPPAGKLDFIPTLMHELAHGLGFLSLVDLASGAKFLGFDDTFMRFLEDHSTGLMYPAMTDAERVTASKNNGNLHWVGPNVATASSLLLAGPVGTHVRMYAPTTQSPGSSVSHWDTVLTPDELLEPFDTASYFPYMTQAAFVDMGWIEFPQPTPTPMPTPTCGSAPEAGCRTPAIGQKAFLSLKDDPDDTKDKLIWKWIKGSPTSKVPDFGTPLTSSTYRLCIYDGTPTLISSSAAPPSGLCNVLKPTPCWQSKSTGFKYKDKDLTPEGLLQVLLKEGEVEKAKIIVIGKGLNLDIPTMPLTQPVTVQIKNTEGVCWEAKYSGTPTNNEMGPPGKFKGKAD